MNFPLNPNNGMKVVLGNGWTISIQWGAGLYCDNRNANIMDAAMNSLILPSTTAEVAAFPPKGEWLYFEDSSDEVCGYVTTAQVLNLIALVGQFDPNPEEQLRLPKGTLA